MKIFKKVVSSAVVFSMLLSMIPSFGLTVNAADMSVAPVKEDDATTMSAHRDILANDGNAAIQIKNMNADYCRLQQTKLYTDDVNMGSAFYKLTQGDFAIDVKVPAGYTYSVKIVGGSSEGYLFDHDYVKGKRLRLPYRNEQSITLKVYLEPVSLSDKWGVVQNRSLFKYTRNNFS